MNYTRLDDKRVARWQPAPAAGHEIYRQRYDETVEQFEQRMAATPQIAPLRIIISYSEDDNE